MVEIKQKMSGCMRTFAGAQDFAAMRSQQSGAELRLSGQARETRHYAKLARKLHSIGQDVGDQLGRRTAL
jgi:hypothetical protein